MDNHKHQSQLKYRVAFVDDELKVSKEGALSGRMASLANRIQSYFEHTYFFELGSELITFVEDPNNPTLDLIFIDYSLSGEWDNGVFLGKKITNINPTIALIVLSTFNEFEYCHEAIRNGFDDYVLKQDFVLETNNDRVTQLFNLEVDRILQLPSFLAKQKAKKIKKERDAAYEAIDEILTDANIPKSELLKKLKEVNPPDERYEILFEVLIDLINEILPSIWKEIKQREQAIAGAVSTIVNDILVDELITSNKLSNIYTNTKPKRLQEYWDSIDEVSTLESIKRAWQIELDQTKIKFLNSISDMRQFKLKRGNLESAVYTVLEKYYKRLKKGQNSILNSHYKNDNQEIVNKILSSGKYPHFKNILPKDKEKR
jgi:YesN/AraC family two-component response regulator